MADRALTKARVIAATALVFALHQAGGAQGQPEALPLGAAAPEFTLASIEGKRVQLKDYRGKKNVLLVFYPALFRAGG